MRGRTAVLALTAAAVPALALAATPSAARPGAGVAVFHPPTRADHPGLTGSSEPATVVGADGTRYVAYQGGSQLSWTRDGGRTWTYVGGKDYQSLLARHTSGCSSAADVGDVELAADGAGRVYFADLQATVNSGGNGVDTGVQPIVGVSDDRFAHYTATCAGHQPASVDREWMAAYSAHGRDPARSDVYLSYHDFSPLNTIWVNASHDGGKTWGQPVNAISDPIAVETSFCDTVPAGTAVDPRNGWVYVAWTAGSNVLDNAATGCNYTQGAVFNNFFVAVSKDGGRTFTDTQAFSAPDVTASAPSDLSEIFGSISVDTHGGVVIAFPAFLHGEYDAYVAYSPPADAKGALHFGTPVKVNGPDVKTAYFVRVVTGDPGRVDVIYLGSPVRNVAATPTNKLTYDGSDPDQPDCTPEVTQATGLHGVRFPGKPCQLPPTTPWYLYLGQSLDLTGGSPSFANVKLRPDPVHTGDICTLGIFCLPGDNRDLADTNDVKIDGTGGAQVAYTAEAKDGSTQEIDFQCQKAGPGLYAGVQVHDCRKPDAQAGPPVFAPRHDHGQRGHRGAGAGSGDTGAGGAGLAETGGLPLAVPGLLVVAAVGAAAAVRRRSGT